MISFDELSKNFSNFMCTIRQACTCFGRDFSDIKIVPAVKMQEPEILESIQTIGIKRVGENRVQELLMKYKYQKEHELFIKHNYTKNQESSTEHNYQEILTDEELDKNSDTEFHFFGHLQTNKVKNIIDKVTLIQSLDRVELAYEIDKQAKRIGKIQDCLVEINIARNPTHSGVAVEEVESFVAEITANFNSINLTGLMCVLPRKVLLNESADSGRSFVNNRFLKTNIYDDSSYVQIDKCQSVPYDKNFITNEHMNRSNDEISAETAAALMQNIHKNIRKKYPNMIDLSMGMSEDFVLAIKYGATILRPGRVLFGNR